MTSLATVVIVEHCRVAPPPGSITTTSLPLTYLDLPWFMVPPVQRVFFYQSHHSKDHFFRTLLPNLKHSLSVTLQHFFPLAGNLIWPQHSRKPEILYTEGDTVLLTVAESTQDFHSLSGNHARSTDEFYHLLPSFGTLTPTDRLVPLLALQVTLFPGTGICMGISVNHVCADGRTSNHFLKSWASVCRLQGDDTLLRSALPVYDRPNLTDHKERDEIVLKAMSRVFDVSKEAFNNSISPAPPTGNASATFVMRPSDVTKLRRWVMACTDKGLRLTSFVLTCAYVWVCLVKSRQGSRGDNMEVFAIVVDGRDQLTPPLPTTYFGNCFGFTVVQCSTEELVQEKGVAVAAELIAKGIQDTRGDIWGSIEKAYANPPFDKTGAEYQLEGVVVSVAGSPKLSVYGTDFGWGKPKKVEVVSIAGRGAISLSESPTEEGALEIGLAGSRNEMAAFTSIYVDNLKTL